MWPFSPFRDVVAADERHVDHPAGNEGLPQVFSHRELFTRAERDRLTGSGASRTDSEAGGQRSLELHRGSLHVQGQGQLHRARGMGLPSLLSTSSITRAVWLSTTIRAFQRTCPWEVTPDLLL